MSLKEEVDKYFSDNYAFLMARVCNQVADRVDAEDILTEAVVSLLRQIGNGRLTLAEDIPRYFTTCILSRTTDFYRKQAREDDLRVSVENGLDCCLQLQADAPPDAALEKEQGSRAVHELIDLEPNQTRRDILTGVFVYGQSSGKVSGELGVTTGYIRQVVGKFKKEHAV